MEKDVGQVQEVNAFGAAPADDGPALPGAFSSPREKAKRKDAGEPKEPGPEAAEAPALDIVVAQASSSSDGNLVRGAARTEFCLPGCSSAEVAVGIEAPPPPPNEEPIQLPLVAMPAPPEAPPPQQEGNNILARISDKMPTMPALPMREGLQRVASISPSGMVMDAMKSAPRIYCEKLARFPVSCLLLYVIIFVTTVSAGWSARKLKVDTNLEQFRRTDGNASALHAAYEDALKHQRGVRNQSALTDRRSFELEIFYQAKMNSVFSEASLRDIRSLEQDMRNLGGWVSMCENGEPRAKFRCEPGESLGNYAWPQRTEPEENMHTPFGLDFDGKSRERFPVDALLTYLNEGKAAPHELRKFVPHALSGSSADSTLLRSVFSFTEPGLNDVGYEQKYKDFVVDELYPFLRDASFAAEETPGDRLIKPWNVSIFFRGRIIDEYEVQRSLEKDMSFAVGALVFMFFIMWLQLRSLFLAVTGLITICFVPLLAYVFVPLREVSLASFMCVFLVIALGTNHLLVSSEYWRRMGRELPRDPFAVDVYYTIRLKRLFPKLALSFLPSFFSMCCYLVMLASLLRPMREFGMYMFACMATTTLLCFTVFVPLLIIHDAYVLPEVTERLPPRVAKVLELTSLRFPWRPAASICIKIARKFGTWILTGTGLVTLIIFIILMVVGFNSDNPGLPEVYSPSHHRHAGRPLIEAFLPTTPANEPPPNRTYMCRPNQSTTVEVNGKSQICGLYWCEAPLAQADGVASTSESNSSQCSCNEPQTSLSPLCENITWDAEMVGQTFASLSSSTQLDIWMKYLKSIYPDGEVSTSETTISRMPSLVLEHWESGKTDVEPFFKMPTVSIRTPPPPSLQQETWQTCTYHTTCFCGLRKCEPEQKYRERSNKVTFETSRRLSSQPPLPIYHRRLSDRPPTPAPSVKEVLVVFGIIPDHNEAFFVGGPKWNFDQTFEPVSPWAQRAMLHMCTQLPASLNVLEMQCWIIEFRAWMLSQGRKFPTELFGDFQADVQQFTTLYPNSATAMWLNENNEMRATAFSFKVPPRQDAWASEILEDRDRWNEYVEAQNGKARSSASNAFATAQMWVDAEAQDAAMRNAWHVLLLAIGIMILAGLIYTWDGVFMLITIAVSILACIWMGFFIFCLFGWAVGPWELILLIVFPCNCLEPVFRIGRGAVWSDYNVKKKIIAQLSPRSRPDAPHQPGAPLAIQDQGELGHSGPAGEAGLPESKSGVEADLLSTRSQTEGDMMLDAQSRFEARLLKYMLVVANATFGNAVKMILCGFLMLPCEFRLFTRMGGIAVVVPFIALPCIFILLPAVLFLVPRHDLPDAVRLHDFVKAKLQGDQDGEHADHPGS